MMYRISMTKKGNVKLVMSVDVAKEVVKDLGEAPAGNAVPYMLYRELDAISGGEALDD
jgi:hypothetical protein